MRVLLLLIFWKILLCRVWCESSPCGCHIQTRYFNTLYRDDVYDTCKKCLTFDYNYLAEQNWTARVCVKTLKPGQTPLLVTARQSVNSISFNVPLTLKGESGEYSTVCRTLCPIANNGGNKSLMNRTRQNIALDFWSKSAIEFEYEVQILLDFIIGTNSPVTLNLTVSEPAVFQYNMPGHLNSVRIQANSDTSECMILSLEDIECPFHDTHETVQQGSYRQTHTKKSSIMVKRDSLRGTLYIVMLLNPHDKDCKETDDDTSSDDRYKEVTVEVTSVYGLSLIGYELWVPAFVILALGFIICACYQGCCEGGNNEIQPAIISPQEETYRAQYYMMSDMVEDKPWSSKSYTYCWNLGVVSIFYALPAIQLVYLSHNFMHKTGNLDECYYNFLCAHPFEIGSWAISDFNHVWSNIGYVILGVIFIGLVWIRESKDPDSPRNVKKRQYSLPLENQEQHKGIPCHYGMFYALGWSLVLEGLMSATYHICPKKMNFQFDTTFMYVICTLCIMKLFYGRHQAISPKAHSFWMMVAISVILPFIGIFSEVAFWFFFFVWAVVILIVTICYVIYPGKIEFTSGTWKCIQVKRLKGTKSYVNMKCRITCVLVGWLLIIVGIVIAKVCLKQDMNTILLAFYMINVVWYFSFYIAMKIIQERLPKELQVFREKISRSALTFCLLAIVLMAIAGIGFFFNNNVEWSDTPALSREKNKKCYAEFDYYDKHDIWHFLSSFSLFFNFMFLLTVDCDLKDKPTSRIAVF